MLKKTKIIATLSDKRCDPEFIKQLYEAGMNVVRLNSAHLDLEKARVVIENVRKVSDRIAILIDTKGPEIRTSGFGSEVEVKNGEIVRFIGDPNGESGNGVIYISYPEICESISEGNIFLIDDGEIEFTIISNKGKYLEARANNSGVVKLRKGVNVPNVSLNLPSITEKDEKFIEFASSMNIDFIAHSFVRNKYDVIDLKNILKRYNSPIKIIAKIENRQGIDNIDEILEHAYGIMIARGDLGIEVAAEKVPIVQRKIVEKCIANKKPVIVATQMLHTMIEHPRPTRAEVNDVAEAVFQRCDAIMLSGETAAGKYPVESVRMMTTIAQEVEAVLDLKPDISLTNVENPVTATLAKAAVMATGQLPLKSIVLDTLSGRTARYIAAYRPKIPVYALCYNQTVMRQLSLSFGVEPFYFESHDSRDSFIQQTVTFLLKEHKIMPDDLIALVGGSFGPTNGATFLEISTVDKLLG
ncbi:MAG TPA: pyruvate kinase [Salinivirgaceae bacterium]|nr:pyruvate kinase [Salinivirgaceae bacterium]